MGKDFKEKYEKVCTIKDRALSLVEMQMNGNIENVDAKELGEVADIAKDMAELMCYCAEAEYYHTIVDAMEKNSDAENRMQMDKYLPESRYYGDGRPPIVYANGNGMNGNSGGNGNNGGGRMYTNPYDQEFPEVYDPMYKIKNRGRMYYTEPQMPSESSRMHDPREGRAGITRRNYMDMKDSSDKNAKMSEMDKYIHDLGDDIIEMIHEMDSTEKAQVKSKITQLANKIV